MNSQKPGKQKLNKAMILAAGFGTRLKPLTDKIPKPLIEYKGKPMIWHVINKLVKCGINDITINAHYFSDQMAEYFKVNDFSVKINLLHEKEILGTGGGIKNAKPYLEDAENFLVYNADVNSEIDLREMYSFHLSNNALVTLAVKKRESSRALIADENNNLLGRVAGTGEKLYREPEGDKSKATFCGMHIISNQIFELFPEVDRFDIIQVYMDLVSSGKKVLCYDIGDTGWEDIGTLDKLLKT
jgi:N-acetyl-alpha-D-muramate 1-phosphate uridylyltransferase